MEYWPGPLEEAKYLLHSSKSKKSFPLKVASNFQLPHSFEKMWVTMSNLYLFLSVKETKFSLWLAPFLCYVVALCESMKLQLENVQEMFFFFFPTLNNSLHFLFGYL